MEQHPWRYGLVVGGIIAIIDTIGQTAGKHMPLGPSILGGLEQGILWAAVWGLIFFWICRRRH